MILLRCFMEGRKPWNCIGTGAPGGRIPGGKPATAIDTNAGNFGKFILLAVERCCFSHLRMRRI